MHKKRDQNKFGKSHCESKNGTTYIFTVTLANVGLSLSEPQIIST